MTPRIRIQDDPIADGISVTIARRANTVTVIYHANAGILEEEFIPAEQAGAYVEVKPTIRLPDDIARALLDALAQHYGGTSEAITLRRDYDHERGRVDQFIRYLLDRGEERA